VSYLGSEKNQLGLVTQDSLQQIHAYAETIEHVLYAELAERTVVSADTGGVVPVLRDLESLLTLNATQVRLCDETIACIERGAYRAAAVMGWSLAFDYMRQWVFDHHLAPFNDALTTEYVRKNGDSVFAAIGDYADFYSGSPSERVIIDTCFLAGIYGEKTRDDLRFLLRRRNDYAHPTFRTPTREQTNAYIKDLIDILLDPPFTFNTRPRGGAAT